MEIEHPRRILAVGAPDSGVLHLLKDLTGSAPDLVTDSTAGLSHEWKLETRYYTATLPIWIDEIPHIGEWREEFVKPEAQEVVSVLGAWVYCFRKPVKEEHLDSVKETLKAIADVVEKACGYSSDSVLLAVAMPQSTTPHLERSFEEWEELCSDFGFEFVDFEAKGKNEFGERVGLQRLKEALETNDWAGDGEDLDDEEGFESTFAAEEAEMNMELFGMKSAVNGDEDGADKVDQVDDLEHMMQRMQAIKEKSEGMPEAERKKFAAKAVSDMMKIL
ncbi:uncharacterized protein BDZ99DRAFT_490322 [Mytilinidion resinicola]|uniref:Alpha and gamma adaptin binding protein p34 n=1 Tax=Mytilinidion resinicola TaxID=574789 RepID=A0A6A6YDE1_9PEZI|nr:uncharacterized protein BDZ99DRAFT_490322 [Mytilinidion resinicola]KAF2806578.1 hypothetical protein BDZ99DRAFT_490322 [Mytilinidion resinicola]